MNWPKNQQDIADRVGHSWCFDHGEPMPCVECAKMPPFRGRCFDCKAELAGANESGVPCSCGSFVREVSLYRYP